MIGYLVSLLAFKFNGEMRRRRKELRIKIRSLYRIVDPPLRNVERRPGRSTVVRTSRLSSTTWPGRSRGRHTGSRAAESGPLERFGGGERARAEGTWTGWHLRWTKWIIYCRKLYSAIQVYLINCRSLYFIAEIFLEEFITK